MNLGLKPLLLLYNLSLQSLNLIDLTKERKRGIRLPYTQGFNSVNIESPLSFSTINLDSSLGQIEPVSRLLDDSSIVLYNYNCYE